MAMKMVCDGVLYAKYYNTITRDVEQPNFITQNFKLKTVRSSSFVKSQYPISAYIKCVLYCV